MNASQAADLFGRVEAIPHEHVVRIVGEHKTWSGAEEYVRALEALALGPNVTAFIGHSDIRVAVMGLDRATRRDVRPTRAEQARMEAMLGEALDAGFIGLSSQQLLFDRIDGDVCRSRTLPSTYAKARELRRLKSLLRRRDRALQSGPDISHPHNIVSQALQSVGFGRPRLRTSLLAAADMKSARGAMWLTVVLAAIANRLGGDFRFQHLPVPFEVYADGIDLVIFEEFGSGAAALHLKTSSNATSCSKMRPIGAHSVRTTTASSARARGTATSSMPRSSAVPTTRWWASPSATSASRAVGCTRSMPSSISSWNTVWSYAGVQRFQTTARRCSANSPSRAVSRWGSLTPALICATWPSTTAG